MSTRADADAEWLNDRSEFQRNWVHGMRSQSGLHLQYRLDGERESDGETFPLVVTDWTTTDDHVGFPGFVHGGLLSAVLDDVMGRSTALYKRWVVTGRMNVRFRSGAPVGAKLRIEGWLTRYLRRVVSASGRILLENGDVIAEADATYLPVPQTMMDSMLTAWPGFSEYVGRESENG